MAGNAGHPVPTPEADHAQIIFGINQVLHVHDDRAIRAIHFQAPAIERLTGAKLTGTLTLSLFPSLDFKTEQFSLTLRGFAENRRTRYSLDPTANMNTWDFNVSAESLYTTSNGWQFNTDIGYNFYRGYTQGYGQPELLWNAGIGKMNATQANKAQRALWEMM